MIPFPAECLHTTGAVPFITSASTADSWDGCQAYVAQFPLGDTSAVAASDTKSEGFNYTAAGAVRLVDATAGLPAGSVVNGGFAASSGGGLCYTTAVPDTSSVFIGGVACTQDGRVHAQILTPGAWYRYAKGITSSAGLVSAWADASGNARHLTQGTGTNQPTLDTDKSILFDGVDNYLTVTFAQAQPFTVYALLKQIAWGATQGIIGTRAAGGGAPLFQNAASPRLAANHGVTLAGPVAGSTPALGVWGAWASVANGAASVIQNNLATASGNAGANNLDVFVIGANAPLSSFANVAFKEVLFFPAAHASATRDRVLRYLAQLGGI